MKKEKSCGIVVFKDDKVLLIHHNLGHWGLPKGHVEKGESEHQTAIREVKEETNIDVQINSNFRQVITYSPKPGVLKEVVFFIGVPNSFSIKPQMEEVCEAEFIQFDQAVNLVTHDNEKELLISAIKYYQSKVE